MLYLLDTNILLRWMQPGTPLCALAVRAVEALHDAGASLFVTAQNLIEFWSVSTRPVESNGLGMTPERAVNETARLLQLFAFAEDTPAVFDEWRQLVAAARVTGARAHDARLVAVMRVHGLTHLLTFDDSDFRPFPQISVVHPRDAGGPA